MALLGFIVLAFAATADASDTKDGVNHVRGESGAYIFSFGANEEK